MAIYQSHKQVYCLHSLEKFEKQFQEETAIYTYLATLGATFIGGRVQQSSYVHNLRKGQLYTYLGGIGYLVLPSWVTECIKVCTQF